MRLNKQMNITKAFRSGLNRQTPVYYIQAIWNEAYRVAVFWVDCETGYNERPFVKTVRKNLPVDKPRKYAIYAAWIGSDGNTQFKHAAGKNTEENQEHAEELALDMLG